MPLSHSPWACVLSHLCWCCKQARQQSVEEVNQRWAAKSHGLLSRISNLEHQLQGQGQSSDSPATSSPSAQVRTPLLAVSWSIAHPIAAVADALHVGL